MITNPNWTEADQQDLMDLIGEVNEKPREAIKQEILVVGGQGAGKQAEAIREIKEAVFTIGRIVSEAADSMMDAIRALLNKSVFDSRPEPPKAKYPLIRGTNKIQAPPVGSIEVRVRSPTIPTLYPHKINICLNTNQQEVSGKSIARVPNGSSAKI